MEVMGLKVKKFSGRYEDYFGWKDDFEAAAVILGFHKLLEASINENSGFILLPGKQNSHTNFQVNYSLLQNDLGSFVQEQIQQHLEEYLIPPNSEKTSKLNLPKVTTDAQHNVESFAHTKEDGRNRSSGDSTTHPEGPRIISNILEQTSTDALQNRDSSAKSTQTRYSGAPKLGEQEFPSSAHQTRSVSVLSAREIRSHKTFADIRAQSKQGTTTQVQHQGVVTPTPGLMEPNIPPTKEATLITSNKLEEDDKSTDSDSESTQDVFNFLHSKTDLITDNIVEFVTDYVMELVNSNIGPNQSQFYTLQLSAIEFGYSN
jgi:hypothetical protein